MCTVFRVLVFSIGTLLRSEFFILTFIYRNFRAGILLRIRSATAIANERFSQNDGYVEHICCWQMPQCHTNTITQILRLLLLLLRSLVNRPLCWYCVPLVDIRIGRSVFFSFLLAVFPYVQTIVIHFISVSRCFYCLVFIVVSHIT